MSNNDSENRIVVDNEQDGKKIASNTSSENDEGLASIKNDIKALMEMFYIKDVPSYGNNFFFTIGVYILELLVILVLSGITMALFGPYWWDVTAAGVFVRSIHLWAAEAFVTLILIHLFVNLSTSAYRHKRLVWMIGSVMLLVALLEFAFGIGMGNNFVGQWNSLSGADLWNGLGLGYWVNPLNGGAIYGWHIAIVPIVLVALIAVHFLTVRRRGISKPYRKDIPFKMVKTDHKKMYRRMAYVLIVVLLFAVFFRAPYTAPVTIQNIAQSQPQALAITFLNEFNHNSSTATYLDSIDPYTFNTRLVYVIEPYEEYARSVGLSGSTITFLNETPAMQDQYIAGAYAYFDGNGSIAKAVNSTNPLIAVVGELVMLSDGGMYQQILQGEANSGIDQTYTLRLLSDTGVMDATATQEGLQVNQWGIIKVAPNGGWQYLEYFMAPYNVLEILEPSWTDLQDGTVAMIAFLLLFLLPFIPYLRDIPDKLKLYKIFWNRFTVPEIQLEQAKKLKHKNDK